MGLALSVVSQKWVPFPTALNEQANRKREKNEELSVFVANAEARLEAAAGSEAPAHQALQALQAAGAGSEGGEGPERKPGVLGSNYGLKFLLKNLGSHFCWVPFQRADLGDR